MPENVWLTTMTRKWNIPEQDLEQDFSDLNCPCDSAWDAHHTMTTNEEEGWIWDSSERTPLCDLSQQRQWGDGIWDAPLMARWWLVITMPLTWMSALSSAMMNNFDPALRCCKWVTNVTCWWPESLTQMMAGCWAWGTWLWPIQAASGVTTISHVIITLPCLIMTIVLWLVDCDFIVHFSIELERQGLTLISFTMKFGESSNSLRSERNSPLTKMNCSKCGWNSALIPIRVL